MATLQDVLKENKELQKKQNANMGNPASPYNKAVQTGNPNVQPGRQQISVTPTAQKQTYTTPLQAQTAASRKAVDLVGNTIGSGVSQTLSGISNIAKSVPVATEMGAKAISNLADAPVSPMTSKLTASEIKPKEDNFVKNFTNALFGSEKEQQTVEAPTAQTDVKNRFQNVANREMIAQGEQPVKQITEWTDPWNNALEQNVENAQDFGQRYTQAVKPVTDFLDNASQKVDTYLNENVAPNLSTAERFVTQAVGNAIPNFARQTLLGAVSGGSVPLLSTLSDIAMFLPSFYQGYEEGKQRGLSDEEAYFNAILRGGIEAGSEHLSDVWTVNGGQSQFDEWLLNKIALSGMNPFAKFVGKNMVSGIGESMEEVAARLGNTITDRAIYGDNIDVGQLALGSLEDAGAAFISTMVLGLLGGQYTNNAYRQYQNDVNRIQTENSIQEQLNSDANKYKTEMALVYANMTDEQKAQYLLQAQEQIAQKDPSDPVANMDIEELKDWVDRNAEKQIMGLTEEQYAKFIDRMNGAENPIAQTRLPNGQTFDVYEYLGNRTVDQERAIDLGNRMGKNIIIADELPMGQNALTLGDGTVIISADAKRPATALAFHEMFHSLKDNGQWEDLMGFAYETMTKEKGYENFLEDLVSRYVGYYGNIDNNYLNSIASSVDLTNEQKRQEVKDYLREQGVNQYYTDANFRSMIDEEVAADFMERFNNEDTIKAMYNRSGNMAEQMWQKLIDAVESFTGTLTQDEENLRKTEQMFADVARQNYEEAKNDIGFADDGSVYPMYSATTWNALGDIGKRQIAEEVAKQTNTEIGVAMKWIDDINSVAAIIGANKDRLDYTPNNAYTALKNDQDYIYTIDMSTLCKKRILLSNTIDEIQKMLPNVTLTGDDYIRICQMMKDKGYEVACGFCYVESRRKFLDTVAQQFIDAVSGNPTVTNKRQLAVSSELKNKDTYIPTLYDLTTADGSNALMNEHPDVYSAFVDFNNARGQNRVKLIETRTEYNGEIMKITEGQIKKLIRQGGLRLQSYSDFETPHLIDMMQVVADMSRRGLTSQAYTKVPNFADAFGETGIKINESLVVTGVDENGELIYDDVEGMPHEIAFALRQKHPENVGTIVVGKDDETILAAMADPKIDFIIPFHKSGWKNEEYANLGIAGYKDYTNYQNERDVVSGKADVGNFYPMDYWDFSVSGDENAKTYLRMCEEQGRIPKFDNFLTKDREGHWVAPSGYWKTLIDFKMYDNDGVGVPQRVVTPTFDDAVNQRILSEYEGDHNKYSPKMDIVNEFIREKGYRYSLDGETFEDFVDNVAANKYNDVPVEVLNEHLAPLGLTINKDGRNYELLWERTMGGDKIPYMRDTSIPKLFQRKLNILNAVEGREQDWQPINLESNQKPTESGDTYYKDLRFDTVADRDAFVAQHPTYLTASELAELEDEGDWDLFDEREADRDDALRDFANYERPRLRQATVRELFEHPERFSHRDLNRFYDAFTPFSLLDFYDDPESIPVEDIVKETMESFHEDRDDEEWKEFLDSTFLARIAPGATEEEIDRIVNEHAYAINPQTDADVPTDDASYMAAVMNGDMELAQQMVDARAREQGYNTPHLYHGTPTGGFTEFDLGRSNKRYRQRFGKGMYFTDRRDVADHYTRNRDFLPEEETNPMIYDVYLNMDNPDRDIIRDIRDGSPLITDVYVARNPNQIKSAEAVTYDDEGNVIPLSERFNPESNDIRYSLDDGTLESAVYIKDGVREDGSTVSFVDDILDRRKLGETRNHPNMPTGWQGLTRGGRGSVVEGRAFFDSPYQITKESPEYASAMIEGTNYDIPDGGSKWYYPILDVEDFRDNPKPVLRNSPGRAKYSVEDIPEQANRYKAKDNPQGGAANIFLGKLSRERNAADPYTYESISPESFPVPDRIQDYIDLINDEEDRKYGFDAPIENELTDEDKDFYQGLVANKTGALQGFATPTQTFNAIAKGEQREELRDRFERPMYETKKEYNANREQRWNALENMIKETGIQANTPESAAVQWYGEGVKPNEQGETIPYTLDDLKREFPNKWQDIQKMERFMREMYDEYVGRINAALEQVYPNLEEKAQAQLQAWKNAKSINLDNLSMPGNSQGSIDYWENQNRILDKKIAKLEGDLESGEYFRNKRLNPRKDYFHHFQEVETSGLGGLKNILQASTLIDPELVGKSEFTKPKSKWMAWLQKRGEGAYTADAVLGMGKYIDSAEYAIAFDPLIAQYRDEISKMVKATRETKNANQLIQYLSAYTNQLAGKTASLDRTILDLLGEGNRGQLFNVLSAINNRAKSNAVVGNVRSAVAQIFNIPNALGIIKSNNAWLKGANDYINAKLGNRELLDQSPFLQERYFSHNVDDLKARNTNWEKIIGKAGDITNKMMEFGDREATELIWLAAYNEGLEKNVSDPIYYADDLTRRSVAGRGIGEVPYNMKSKVASFFMPFQVETNNAWQELKQNLRDKDANGIFRLMLGSYILNGFAKLLFNDGVVPDVLGALIDGIKKLFDKDREESVGEVALNTGKRIAGEAVSYIPGTSLWLPAIMSDESAEALFGDSDPTRYGTGTVGLSTITKTLADAVDGGDFDIVTPLLQMGLPYGGRQASRLYNTLQDFNVLPSNGVMNTPIGGEKNPVAGDYTQAGALKYRLPEGIDSGEDLAETLRAVFFGSNATNAASEYYDTLKPVLSKERVAKLREHPEVNPDTYIDYLNEASTDGKQGITQQEAYDWISSHNLSDEEANALWEMTSSSWKKSYDEYQPKETKEETPTETPKEEKTENKTEKKSGKPTTKKEFTDAADANNSGRLSQAEAYDWLNSQKLSDAEKEALWNLMGWKTDYETYVSKH